ncbi:MULTISPECIES: BlaI/MecI/CopY family transcriptional regulator [Rhodococcus]|uniref:BlaI/MecI/CopY family transcriptional regulator n=1 Tax=Rhodococcus TaxID=1827 RepID=UPI001E32120A|nr:MULTISPECIES: BlaI/MecI/CopY family transcriptional regulator [Rhodococcus]MCD2107329.1 BlaI/MecI/CopY family transcriptional regulator [Rhodococcus qingshengii]MCZ4526976.1 BlaI/MecI/CopY family transcriptional regulator [Rhodococcus erythropolis]MDV8005645.1 BlaI/MecI/CopY family transcriptional regulator [Rhodococcus sp. IEGM 1318]MDZ7917893.1 BlaI/MecI/CopY family transcriptional regulator [Rhodococcus sp. (in: high G+C Gram-positive bacteria)]
MQGLGGLEAEVMDVLWQSDDALSVKDLVEILGERRQLAYTTILTVVTHLYDKGWVSREKKSRAYFYRPSRSREEATSRALRELLDSSSDSAAVLLHFARTMTDAENEALRRGLSGEGAQ